MSEARTPVHTTVNCPLEFSFYVSKDHKHHLGTQDDNYLFIMLNYFYFVIKKKVSVVQIIRQKTQLLF